MGRLITTASPLATEIDELHDAIVSDSPRFNSLLEAFRHQLNDGTASRHAPPLHTAAAWGRDEMVEQLLDAGAEIDLICPQNVDDAYRSSALDLALLNQHSSTSRLLLDRGAQPSFFTYVALNDANMVREQVTQNPAVMLDDRFFPGCLPIHFAASVSSNATIDLLCELGADVNARDAAGHSPMRYACFYFRGILVLQTLHVHGGEVNNTALDGATPLINVCAHYETLPAVRWLLERGANPNLTTSDGRSPLLVAVRERVAQAVELLLQHGADPDFRGADGLTAPQYAAQKRFSEISELFQRAAI